MRVVRRMQPCLQRFAVHLSAPCALSHFVRRRTPSSVHKILCMQDMLLDILRALSSPNMDIRKKTLDISMDLITSRNIDEVSAFVSCGKLARDCSHLKVKLAILTSDTIVCPAQVVMVLKKEVVKTQNKDFEKGGDYRQMLVQVSVHAQVGEKTCCLFNPYARAMSDAHAVYQPYTCLL